MKKGPIVTKIAQSTTSTKEKHGGKKLNTKQLGEVIGAGLFVFAKMFLSAMQKEKHKSLGIAKVKNEVKRMPKPLRRNRKKGTKPKR